MQTVEPRAIGRVRTRWIRQPAWDVAMALSWIPFAALAVYWDGDSNRIQWLVGATLIWAVWAFGSFEVYGLVFLTLGALHLFYDGLIWKLRRPEVARGFRIAAQD